MDEITLLHSAQDAVRRRPPVMPENGGTQIIFPYVAQILTRLGQRTRSGTDWRKYHSKLMKKGALGAPEVIPEVEQIATELLGDPISQGGPRPAVNEPAEVLDPHVLPENWVDELYENAKEQARLRQMTKKSKTVFHLRIPENLPVMHVWTADWHLIDGGTDHDLFDEDCEIWRSTPGIYLGLGGDYANWFSPVVLARAMPANALPSDYTEPIVRRKMAMLVAQILYGVIGNHDEMPGATGWHPVNSILRDLGKPDLGPGGRIFLQVGSVQYQIEARHSFNFNSALNDTNSHRQLWTQAGKPDMVFTAHLHHPTMHHRTFDGDDTVWARNGSYKREDHYARSKNFVHTQSEPADQPGVILLPDQKKMIPFRDYRDGLTLLAALRAEYAARLKQTA